MARFKTVTSKAPNKYDAVDNLMEDEFKNSKRDYYLLGDLTDNQVSKMESIMNTPHEKKMAIASLFEKSAALAGRKSNPAIKLRQAQIDPILLSYINPRFFIGDSPGLGKTVMSAGSYAYYRLQQIKNNLTYGKVLVVTDSIHVHKFAKEWDTFGIKLLELSGGSAGIARILKKADMKDYDGVIINWGSISTNSFIEYWLINKREYTSGVFDETSKLLNEKSQTFKVTDAIVNGYEKGLERVIFLNGTSFEKVIYDFYYQFKILKPKLIPSKAFLDARYVIKTGKEVFMRDPNPNGSFGVIKRRIGQIVDYKNQSELRDRLKYYFIARSKSDYSDDLPQHSYILHGVTLTSSQKKLMEMRSHISLLNSPATSDSRNTLSPKTSPKLKQLLDFLPTVEDDRPLIYVYNTESQKTIKEEVEKLGYRVEILNGAINSERKNQVLDMFNNKELDVLIFNITKAMNVPTSDRILFYDIPAMPQETTQIKARIDRNNYTDKKFYDFFCYLDSPEMVNLVKLAYFREHHGNEFTGQVENVYGQLVQQLTTVYDIDCLDTVGQKFDWMYENSKQFEDIETEIVDLLDI